MAISPDSKWLATASFDRTARLWSLSAKDPSLNPRILSGHEGYVYAVAFSHDNHWLVTTSDDKTVRLWDLPAKDPAANPEVLTGHENGVEFKKKAKCGRSSESFPAGLLCNQYNPESTANPRYGFEPNSEVT